MKQLLIFGNRYQQDDTTTVLSLLQHLRERGLEIAVEREYLSFLYHGGAADVASFQVDDVPPADMAVSLGGDGTFLTTVMWVARQGMPILGINMGHLGYLTAGRLVEGNDLIDDVLADENQKAAILKAARENSERFTSKILADHMIHIYRSVLMHRRLYQQ